MTFFEEADEVLGKLWNFATNKYTLLTLGGVTFAAICAASGGFIAGTAATYNYSVSAGSAAFTELSTTCQAAIPHLQAAGCTVAEWGSSLGL